jgi:hypothetical protein
MSIDYETGTSFYGRFELTIQASELFPVQLKLEVIPWQGNCFNITKITSYEPIENKTSYYELDRLTEAQQKFIRDVLSKHYIRHRKFMLLTEGDFALEEDTLKYWLRMEKNGGTSTYK